MKLRITKTVLWLLAGFGLSILVLRLINGPGSVTELTDIIPWGLWKGGGVVALVALGGAGFTLAMFVYIFHWKRYQPLVRGAVLLALLAYSSVGLGLTIDIGIWWRIVFPVVHWQVHSVLFEVAWCIMLYLGVLMFEFGHTALERFGFKRALAALHKVTLVFVIAGISLSTLHQSSLGTLFLATPFRLHPLWHTDFLPLLFFVSAMGVGCLSISLVALFVHWLHDAEPPTDSIAGLGRVAAVLMAVYLVLRFGEIFVAGEGALLFAGRLDTLNFWVEILLSAALPVALLARPTLRRSPAAMFWISLCAVVGFTLNRVNVAGLGTLSSTHARYWPAWTEWAVTFGIMGAAGLIYLFVAERFALFDAVGEQAKEPVQPAEPTRGRRLLLQGSQQADARLYSFAFVLAGALSMGCASDDALFGVQPESVPVARPRVVHQDSQKGSQNDQLGMTLLIDGNQNGRQVVFDHNGHVARLADRGKGDCGQCHHMNQPMDDATGCSECHGDMYQPLDIFDHDLHAKALGGNEGCSECHTDPNLRKVRQNTTGCEHCHADMRVADSRITPTTDAFPTQAVGYTDAMHGLCIDCHEQHDARHPAAETAAPLGECVTCHSTKQRSVADSVLESRRQAPLASQPR